MPLEPAFINLDASANKIVWVTVSFYTTCRTPTRPVSHTVLTFTNSSWCIRLFNVYFRRTTSFYPQCYQKSRINANLCRESQSVKLETFSIKSSALGSLASHIPSLHSTSLSITDSRAENDECTIYFIRVATADACEICIFRFRYEKRNNSYIYLAGLIWWRGFFLWSELTYYVPFRELTTVGTQNTSKRILKIWT